MDNFVIKLKNGMIKDIILLPEYVEANIVQNVPRIKYVQNAILLMLILNCFKDVIQLQLGQNCEQGWYKFENKCYQCREGCRGCSYQTNQQGKGYVRCWVCDPGYILLLYNEDAFFTTLCYISYKCFSYYYVQSFQVSQNGEYHYNIKCEQCDIGYSLSQDGRCILTGAIKQNCFHLNEADNKCLACMPWYALQPDGTCSLISCSPNCQTCLDTNPKFCTTCDGSKGKVLDEINGICLCLPPTGVYNDICKPCKEGYCNECEVFDFFQCTSCKLGSNRILVNQECICQSGTYDPQNDDQICLACDNSCLTCSGPSKYECTQCLDESISNRISIDKSCPCKIGYADSEIREFICGKCHPRCRICFKSADETMDQYCLTCIPGENRIVTDNFTCDCQYNYGDNNGTNDICFTCHYTCGNCQNPEPTGCTYCLLSSNRDLTTYGECLCQKSYYDDENDNIECKTLQKILAQNVLQLEYLITHQQHHLNVYVLLHKLLTMDFHLLAKNAITLVKLVMVLFHLIVYHVILLTE
ncbi:unnamed protein product [Paramecium sonneborni]|uniref:Insulin-like growth factor binding protein, N-terminal n=1 Tax=Paramecium sonneborni TaxID=65129 RepID=A0A8S1PYH4_9CILI|nr:unnamed protein product [Paramecium sonneborni]